MTIVNLNKLQTEGRAIAGLVCLGWEEVRAYVAAAELENSGVALMVGPGARANMPLPIWGKMLRHAAENASVPIAVHLDHGNSLDEVKLALDLGFSSVMYDGSKLRLEDNIKTTRKMVELAQSYSASTEGEIGYVGYANGASSSGTNPFEANKFAQDTGVDFMAVSVGNVHLQTDTNAEPDWELLMKLAQIQTPMVIHGGSGFSREDRQRMAQECNVRKFNIGTQLRQVYGTALRNVLEQHPNLFDHIEISKRMHSELVEATRRVISGLNSTNK